MGQSDTEAFEQKNQISEELHGRADRYLPGGDTRSVTYNKPFPAYVQSATGCRITTVDGRELVDFVNNYTQAVVGHAHENVVEAVNTQFEQGNGLAAPTEEIIELAETLCSRIPSVDKVRFTNSGTEATMNAIRGAIAYNDLDKILKVEGGYHGTHDTVEVGVSNEGRENPGIPREVENRVLTVPYNDPEQLKDTFERYQEEISCFIVEPILGAGGMIPATQEYLQTARDLTDSNDTVLIFDEVMTFRLAVGGAQERYGVRPDLTCLGKCIGGGLPVGAFGGREEIMELFHPDHGGIEHSGTFNGNPATMAGGIATLEVLDEQSIKHINGLGEKVRGGMESVISDAPLDAQVTGDGSFFFIHFSEEEIKDTSSSTGSREKSKDLFMKMHNNGVFMAPRGMGNISTPMGEAEVELFIDEFEKAFNELE